MANRRIQLIRHSDGGQPLPSGGKRPIPMAGWPVKGPICG